MPATPFDYDVVLADTLDVMLRVAGVTCTEMGIPRTSRQADVRDAHRVRE